MNPTCIARTVTLGINLFFILMSWIPFTHAALNCESPTLSQEEKLECLFLSEEKLIEGSPQGASTGTSLPHGDLGIDFLPFFINTALSIAGTIIFSAFLYAGYLLVFLNNNEEKIEKGKKILMYSAIGAAVMATSYAIIYGIANLDLD